MKQLAEAFARLDQNGVLGDYARKARAHLKANPLPSFTKSVPVPVLDPDEEALDDDATEAAALYAYETPLKLAGQSGMAGLTPFPAASLPPGQRAQAGALDCVVKSTLRAEDGQVLAIVRYEAVQPVPGQPHLRSAWALLPLSSVSPWQPKRPGQ